MCATAHRGQERESDPLVLELQAGVSRLTWMLETELESVKSIAMLFTMVHLPSPVYIFFFFFF